MTMKIKLEICAFTLNAMTFQNPRLLDLGQVVHADTAIIREMRAICDRAAQ